MKQLVYYDNFFFFFFPPNLISCVRTMKYCHTFKKITYSVFLFALEVSGRISRAPLYHQSCTFCLLQLEICTAYICLHIPPSEMSGILFSVKTLYYVDCQYNGYISALGAGFFLQFYIKMGFQRYVCCW